MSIPMIAHMFEPGRDRPKMGEPLLAALFVFRLRLLLQIRLHEVKIVN